MVGAGYSMESGRGTMLYVCRRLLVSAGGVAGLTLTRSASVRLARKLVTTVTLLSSSSVFWAKSPDASRKEQPKRRVRSMSMFF